MVNRKKGITDRELISNILKSMLLGNDNSQREKQLQMLDKQSNLFRAQNKRLTDTVLTLVNSVTNLTNATVASKRNNNELSQIQQCSNKKPQTQNKLEELQLYQDNYDKELAKLKVDILKNVLGQDRYDFFQMKTNMVHLFDDLIQDFEDYNEPEGVKRLRGCEFEYRVARELKKQNIKFKTEEKCIGNHDITRVDFVATIIGTKEFKVVQENMYDTIFPFSNCTLAIECKSGCLASVKRQAAIVRNLYPIFILMIPTGVKISKSHYEELKNLKITIARSDTSRLYLANLSKSFINDIKEKFKKATV